MVNDNPNNITQGHTYHSCFNSTALRQVGKISVIVMGWVHTTILKEENEIATRNISMTQFTNPCRVSQPSCRRLLSILWWPMSQCPICWSFLKVTLGPAGLQQLQWLGMTLASWNQYWDEIWTTSGHGHWCQCHQKGIETGYNDIAT